jgi:hypothetical protein
LDFLSFTGKYAVRLTARSFNLGRDVRFELAASFVIIFPPT